MNHRLRLLAVQRRRSELLARCASDRLAVAALAEQWRVPLAAADRVVSAVHYVRAHPVLVAAGAGALMLVRRSGFLSARGGGLVRWVRRGVVAWRAYAALRQWRHSRYENA